MVVSRWLVPAIPACKLDDQFGFRTTGSSTTCDLICLLHHVTAMLELLAQETDRLLFTKMASDQHCIHFLLPDIKSSNYCLRPKGHAYQLPRCDYTNRIRDHLYRGVFLVIMCSFYYLRAVGRKVL